LLTSNKKFRPDPKGGRDGTRKKKRDKKKPSDSKRTEDLSERPWTVKDRRKYLLCHRSEKERLRQNVELKGEQRKESITYWEHAEAKTQKGLCEEEQMGGGGGI